MDGVEESNLIERDTTFVLDVDSQEQAFAEIASELLRRGLVSEDFLSRIMKREEEYPTGMDMSLVCPGMPNIAIPHTDPEYVNVTRVVPVGLAKPLAWHVITDADQIIDVSFLFVILNCDGAAQTGVLSRIMDCVIGLGAGGASRLFSIAEPDALYFELSGRL